jgi:hypothetical protein
VVLHAYRDSVPTHFAHKCSKLEGARVRSGAIGLPKTPSNNWSFV